MEEVRQFLKWGQMLLSVYGYSPLICECGARMEGKRLRLKSENIDGEEMVRMECVSCHGWENVEAGIAFECWEFDGGPFPMFECPFCDSGTMIPRQVIEETKVEEEKEKKRYICTIISAYYEDWNFLNNKKEDFQTFR